MFKKLPLTRDLIHEAEEAASQHKSRIVEGPAYVIRYNYYRKEWLLDGYINPGTKTLLLEDQVAIRTDSSWRARSVAFRMRVVP